MNCPRCLKGGWMYREFGDDICILCGYYEVPPIPDDILASMAEDNRRKDGTRKMPRNSPRKSERHGRGGEVCVRS